MVHRALISAYNLGNDGLSDQDKETFRNIAEHISKTERIAMVAERESKDRYIAAFMSEHVGDIFEGKISGVNRFGLFITLNDSGGDGLVPISSLPYDYYHHVEERHALIGEKTNLTFQLGQTVTVKLVEANPVTGGLVLDICMGDDIKNDNDGPFRNNRKGHRQRGKAAASKSRPPAGTSPQRRRKYRKK